MVLTPKCFQWELQRKEYNIMSVMTGFPAVPNRKAVYYTDIWLFDLSKLHLLYRYRE